MCVCVYTLDIRSSMAVEPTTNTRSPPPISVDFFFQPYLLPSENSVEKQTQNKMKKGSTHGAQ